MSRQKLLWIVGFGFIFVLVALKLLYPLGRPDYVQIDGDWRNEVYEFTCPCSDSLSLRLAKVRMKEVPYDPGLWEVNRTRMRAMAGRFKEMSSLYDVIPPWAETDKDPGYCTVIVLQLPPRRARDDE